MIDGDEILYFIEVIVIHAKKYDSSSSCKIFQTFSEFKLIAFKWSKHKQHMKCYDLLINKMTGMAMKLMY